MQKRKMLFVTDVFPHPLDRGDRVRILNLLQASAEIYEITLVVPRPKTFMPQHLPRCVSQVVFVDTETGGPFKWRQYVHAIRSSIGLPFSSMVRYRAQFLRAISTLDLGDFEIIWAERPHLGCLFRAQRARTIVDLDDVEHLRMRRLISLQRLSWAKAHNIYRYLVYRHAELRQFRGFLRLLVCSQSDRDYLTVKGAGVVAIVPNGAVVPLTRRPSGSRIANTPLRVVFLGNMGHPPNDDAVRFFADQVLPGTQGIVASFDVIGPNASAALRRDYSDRVTFRGYVEDLASALSQYDVMVAPIRFGSGTKLKIIEAMANGLVFVATDCAAAGLDLVHDKHALLASTPDDIIESLRRLCQSPQSCEQLAARAFSHARERFSWAMIQGNLTAELRQWSPGLDVKLAGHSALQPPLARTGTNGRVD